MKKVVFIMGPGHCGSTLLDLIIGSHSNAFSLGEFHRFWHVWEQAATGEYLPICGVCEAKCPFWNTRASLPILKLLYSKQNKLYSLTGKLGRYVIHPYNFLFKWSGKNILIDSSKQPVWFAQQLEPAYTWNHMEAYLIYMCRDGRAVVNSYFRKYPERGIKKITENWMRQVSMMNEYYEHYPEHRKMQVHYERLASNPEQIVTTICNFLGIQYEPDMLRYWMHDHHHVFGNGGTRSLIYKYRKQFQPASNALLKRIEKSKKYYSFKYYDEVDIAIKLDIRWTRELPSDAVDEFDQLAREMNKPFVYEPVP